MMIRCCVLDNATSSTNRSDVCGHLSSLRVTATYALVLLFITSKTTCKDVLHCWSVFFSLRTRADAQNKYILFPVFVAAAPAQFLYSHVASLIFISCIFRFLIYTLLLWVEAKPNMTQEIHLVPKGGDHPFPSVSITSDSRISVDCLRDESEESGERDSVLACFLSRGNPMEKKTKKNKNNNELF